MEELLRQILIELKAINAKLDEPKQPKVTIKGKDIEWLDDLPYGPVNIKRKS